MKKLFVGLLLILGCSVIVRAQVVEVSLAWDPNPPSDNVIGYHIYRTETQGVYMNGLPTAPDPWTMTTFTDRTAQPGHTYYYIVTAYNALGESGRSNEVIAAIATLGPPRPPSNLRRIAGLIEFWKRPSGRSSSPPGVLTAQVLVLAK